MKELMSVVKELKKEQQKYLEHMKLIMKKNEGIKK